MCSILRFSFNSPLPVYRRPVCLFFALYFTLSLPSFTTAQEKNQHTVQKQQYIAAFAEISQMLEGKIPIQFKRAVFLMENAYLHGTLDYNQFNAEIGNIATKLKLLIKEKQIEHYHTAGNWAAFTYMIDSIPANNYQPFKYDFQHFIANTDPTVGFVTKLLKTKKGNCNSLPFLYKILTEECGASASLALAPFHCFIKHKDEKGNWVNLEMTSGSFARDEWIMQQAGVTVEQIKSGIYMDALTQKQSLALILKDLSANYQLQFGADDFDKKIIETGLRYFPNGIYLYLVEFEHYRIKLLAARKAKQERSEEACNKILAGIEKKLNDLGYKNVSVKEYEDWVKENEKHKPITKSN